MAWCISLVELAKLDSRELHVHLPYFIDIDIRFNVKLQNKCKYCRNFIVCDTV